MVWKKAYEGIYQTTHSLEFVPGYFKLILDWIVISEICEPGSCYHDFSFIDYCNVISKFPSGS